MHYLICFAFNGDLILTFYYYEFTHTIIVKIKPFLFLKLVYQKNKFNLYNTEPMHQICTQTTSISLYGNILNPSICLKHILLEFLFQKPKVYYIVIDLYELLVYILKQCWNKT